MCIDRLSLLTFILQKLHDFLLVLSIAYIHRSFLVISDKWFDPKVRERVEDGRRRKQRKENGRSECFSSFNLRRLHEDIFEACCVLLKNLLCYCYFLSRYQESRAMLAAHFIRTLCLSLCCTDTVHVRLQGSIIALFFHVPSLSSLPLSRSLPLDEDRGTNQRSIGLLKQKSKQHQNDSKAVTKLRSLSLFLSSSRL